MANRPVIDPSLQQPALQPAATPVSTYFQPKLPGSVYQAVTDLSGLSSSLAKVQTQMAAKDAEVQHAEALSFAQAPENADLLKEVTAASNAQDAATARRAANQKATQRLVQSGKIALSDSPWLPVAFQEVGAGEVMGQYNTALQNRLNEVSVVLDPKTGLPTEPGSAEKIISDTWKQYGSNPIFKGYYGAQVLNKTKEGIEQDFRARAEKRLGQAREQGLEDLTTKQLTTFVKQYVGKPIDPDASAQITDTIKRLNLLGMMPEKQTDILLQTVKSGQQYAALSGPAVARQFLSDMEGVKLPQGGTLGDNPVLQDYMDKQREQLTHQQLSEDTEAYTRYQHQLAYNTGTAADEAMKFIADARAAGQQKSFDDWAAQQPADRFGVPTQRVLAQAKDDVEKLLSVQYNNNAAVGEFVDAQGRAGTKPEDLALILKNNATAYTPETRARFQAVIDERKNVLKTLSTVPAYSRGLDQLETTLRASLSTISKSPEGLLAYDKGIDLRNEAEQVMVDTASGFDPKDTVGLQKAIGDVSKQYREKLNAQIAQSLQEHTDLTAQVQREIQLGSDGAAALLTSGERVLSPEELQQYRSQLFESKRQERAFYESDTGAWRKALDERVHDQFVTFNVQQDPNGPHFLNNNQLKQVDDIETGAREAARQALAAWRKDPNADPADRQRVALDAGKAYAQDRMDKALGEKAAPPPTPEQTLEQGAQKQAIKDAANQSVGAWRAAMARGDKDGADKVFADLATAGHVLPDDVVKSLRKFASNPQDPAATADLQAGISRAAATARDNPAKLATLSPVVPMSVDDIIAGRMVIPHVSDGRRNAVVTEYNDLRAEVRQYAGPARFKAIDEQIARDGVFDIGAKDYEGMNAPNSAEIADFKRLAYLGRLVNDAGVEYKVKGQPLSPFTNIKDVPDWPAFVRKDPERAAKVAKAFGLETPELVTPFQRAASAYRYH